MPDPFGTLDDGTVVHAHTLRNPAGIVVRVLDYGGIIQSLEVPDRDGRAVDVVLGFDSLEPYTSVSPYFGALIGRYANRIGGGRFALDGRTFTLARNDPPNHLHGGERGFDRRLWSAEPFEARGRRGLVLRYVSPDGEEGYPGTLRATASYTLSDDGRLVFDFQATTDRATPVNLTQHSYFNLAGAGAGSVLGHVARISAESFTPVDATLIPTGELRSVAGTPFDFRAPTPLGQRIDGDDAQLRHGHGYDHNLVLEPAGEEGGLRFAARLDEPASGRTLEILTDQPGLQLYTGNYLDGTLKGKGGVAYGRHAGVALETQHFPDSPNRPEFPASILRPGQLYHTRTAWRFSVSG